MILRSVNFSISAIEVSGKSSLTRMGMSRFRVFRDKYLGKVSKSK